MPTSFSTTPSNDINRRKPNPFQWNKASKDRTISDNLVIPPKHPTRRETLKGSRERSPRGVDEEMTLVGSCHVEQQNHAHEPHFEAMVEWP
jgi:hypothetical protein